MLRTIYFYLIALPATGLFSAIAIAFPRFAGWSGRTWAGILCRATGAPLAVDLSALDPDRNYVFMANHQSQLDIPLLNHVLGSRKVGFVAKQSLFDIPLFGRASVAAGHIPIDRSNGRRAMKSIDAAAESAKNGAGVIIFPEGTRSEDLSKIHEFKVGGMLIALKSGLPVAPVVVTGTGFVLRKRCLRIRRAPIRVRALPPLETSGYTLKDRERFMADLHAMMDAAYREQLKEEGLGDAA
ncbi:lysophospholipid acyltransferase family protein [Desulfocurvus sp. DL9XJH121]